MGEDKMFVHSIQMINSQWDEEDETEGEGEDDLGEDDEELGFEDDSLTLQNF